MTAAADMQHTTVEVSVNMPAFPIEELPGKILLPDDHFTHRPLSTQNTCSKQAPKLVTSRIINKNIEWSELTNVEHLTRGGSSLVYSARYKGKLVVVKTLRPKIRQSRFAVSDIESELGTFELSLWHEPLVTMILTLCLDALIISNPLTAGPCQHCEPHWGWDDEQLWSSLFDLREAGWRNTFT